MSVAQPLTFPSNQPPRPSTREAPLWFLHRYFRAHPSHQSQAAKLLAYTVAGHCNGTDECFLFMETLAREMHVSLRTAQRAMRELVDGPHPLVRVVRWHRCRQVFALVRHPDAFAGERDAARTALVAEARARRKSPAITEVISRAAAAAVLGKLPQGDADAVIAAAERRARGRVPHHVLARAVRPADGPLVAVRTLVARLSPAERVRWAATSS